MPTPPDTSANASTHASADDPSSPAEALGDAPPPSLRTLQFVSLGLMAGLATFTVVALFVEPSGGRTNPLTSLAGLSTSQLLVAVAGFLLANGLVLCTIVLPAMLRARAGAVWSRRTDDQQGGAAVFQQFAILTIMRQAVIEGPGLLAAVAFLLTGDALTLVVVAVSLAVMAAFHPYRSTLQSFVTRALSSGVR